MHAEAPFADSENIPGTPYQVIRLVGVGGMGFVYEVEHQIIGKRFVLKTLRGELVERPGFVEHLKREWLLLGKLEHPNVVRAWNAGVTESGVPFFAMDYLDGETLHAAMERRGQFPVEEALRITHAVLLGLGAAHEIGFVHRDVNPKNVFLTNRDSVKLLDFGIANGPDMDAAESSERILLGMPRYTSPEQAKGEAADAAGDLYSVGVLLFEMLAGRSPFEARNHREWLWCHLEEVPPLCSELATQPISPPLDALIESLLEKDPALRPPSAHAAAERVAELMGTDETLADTDDRLFERVRERALLLAAESSRNVDVATVIDADATQPGTPEAIAAIRRFRASEAVSDPASDRAALSTPAELAVEPRRRPEWWPLAIVATVLFGSAALGWVALGWATFVDERERSDVTSAQGVEREPVIAAVAPSSSASAQTMPVASALAVLPVPLPVPSAVTGEAVRPAAAAGRAQAASRKPPRSSPKKNAQGIDLRYVSVAKGGTWVDKPVRLQNPDGTWVVLPPSGLRDKEPAKPEGTAKPKAAAKKKAPAPKARPAPRPPLPDHGPVDEVLVPRALPGSGLD